VVFRAAAARLSTIRKMRFAIAGAAQEKNFARDEGSLSQEGKEAVTFFEKKVTKKTSIPPAFEWPKFGRSKAGGTKSFCALFSKSAAFFNFT